MKMTPLLHAFDDDTLYNLFAGLAMQSMCAGEGAKMVALRDERYDGQNDWDKIVADNAFNFADAMMVERAKRIKRKSK